MKQVKAFNIDWDVDNKKDLRHLPKEVTVDIPEDEIDDTEDEEEIVDYVSDYLSDTYGFCHNGFHIE